MCNLISGLVNRKTGEIFTVPGVNSHQELAQVLIARGRQDEPFVPFEANVAATADGHDKPYLIVDHDSISEAAKAQLDAWLDGLTSQDIAEAVGGRAFDIYVYLLFKPGTIEYDVLKFMDWSGTEVLGSVIRAQDDVRRALGIERSLIQPDILDGTVELVRAGWNRMISTQFLTFWSEGRKKSRIKPWNTR